MLRSVLRTACAVLLVSFAMVTSAAAQTADKRTLFTFSGPVAIPGKTLPAGQYLFRLADPMTSTRVIEVRSGDGKTPYGYFFSIPAERPDAAAQPEVRFMETAKGMPSAIRTWWYPGDRLGYEFVYPKDQARRLAQAIAGPVLTTKAETTTPAQTDTSDLARVSSSGSETAVNADTKPVSANPTGTAQAGTIASSELSLPKVDVPAVTNAASTSASNPVPTTGTEVAGANTGRTRLPQTASMVPIVAAFGTLTVIAGGIMMLARRNPSVFTRLRRR
jgi:hypothetical protein